MKSKNNFKKIFHEARLKNTAPRLAIIEALSRLTTPKSAQELCEILKKENIDLVTLYRTLAAFEKAGIVRRVDLRTDSVLYELNADHHHHIVCTSCGEVEDFEACDIGQLTKKIAMKAKKFKTVSQHSLELFGLCNACVKG